MLKVQRSAINFILVLLSVPVFGQFKIQPFYSHNQSPFIHFFGLPNNEGGNISQKGQWIFRNHLNLVSNAVSKQLPDEEVYFDGEMYRFDNSLRYGISRGVELGIDIPVVHHSGGIFDKVISEWHGFFNMPAKSRNSMPEDDMRYTYKANGSYIVYQENAHTGIGDISFLGSVKLIQKTKHNISLRSLLKLPTGDKKRLVGSGTADFAVQLNGTCSFKSWKKETLFFYSGGILFLGKGGYLEEMQYRQVGYGSIGWAFGAYNRIVPKLQFDWHTPFYRNSRARPMGNFSLQIVFGADIALNSQTGLEFGVIEDILVNTAPDVVFQFGFNRYF